MCSSIIPLGGSLFPVARPISAATNFRSSVASNGSFRKMGLGMPVRRPLGFCLPVVLGHSVVIKGLLKEGFRPRGGGFFDSGGRH
jgi:hypothetical protein